MIHARLQPEWPLPCCSLRSSVRLAACAQVEKIDSVYAWKGKIETGNEYRVLFKTVEARYDAVERVIRELHSYELPAIHAVAVTHISAPYAAWIEENAA